MSRTTEGIGDEPNFLCYSTMPKHVSASSTDQPCGAPLSFARVTDAGNSLENDVDTQGLIQLCLRQEAREMSILTMLCGPRSDKAKRQTARERHRGVIIAA